METRNQQELEKAVRSMIEQFEKRWKSRKFDNIIEEIADLAMEIEIPNFWDDPENARKISQRKALLEKELIPWKDFRQELLEFPDLMELTYEETEDKQDAFHVLVKDFTTLAEKYDDLIMSEALMGDDDKRNAILTINPGAGGTESQDWAEMLLRMYMRWIEKRGFSCETLDMQHGEEAGIKNVSMLVRGELAFGYLKAENGIHRLVRISPFDSNKRRHTSFASVHIMPEIDDSVDVNIDKKDLREDTYRSSGAGGQHVNKTDSAVRLTHIPTGTVVQCQNERSQFKNRATAMKMLRAKLYDLEKKKKDLDLKSRSGEKKDVAWGNQIRSYVFHPYKMVKDLRTDHETGNVDAVMDGDLDPFIYAYLKSIEGARRKPGDEKKK